MSFIYLDYIVPGCVLIPLFVFLFRYKVFPHALKIVFFYLLASSLINATGIMFAHYHRSNLWLLHVYTIVEATLMLSFFVAIYPSGRMKMIATILMYLFPAFCIINLLLLQSIHKFNSYASSVEALILIILAVGYWLRKNEKMEYELWSQDPYNWMISGIILYFSSSFLLFIFSNFILAAAHKGIPDKLANAISLLWNIHGSVIIIQYLLFTIGFSKLKNVR